MIGKKAQWEGKACPMDAEWIESWHLDQSVLQKNEFSRQGGKKEKKNEIQKD